VDDKRFQERVQRQGETGAGQRAASLPQYWLQPRQRGVDTNNSQEKNQRLHPLACSFWPTVEQRAHAHTAPQVRSAALSALFALSRLSIRAFAPRGHRAGLHLRMSLNTKVMEGSKCKTSVEEIIWVSGHFYPACYS